MASGQLWQKELSDKRISLAAEALQNGGRGLTFPELHKKVLEEVPGGKSFNIKLIHKVAFGLEQGMDISDTEKVKAIHLPNSRAMSKWLNEREKKREQFAKKLASKQRYNEKIKKLGVKSLKELPTGEEPKRKAWDQNYRAKLKKLGPGAKSLGKSRRKMNPDEAITRIQAETSVEGILSRLSELPEALKLALEDLKLEMGKHKLGKVECVLQNDKMHITILPIPQSTIVTM